MIIRPNPRRMRAFLASPSETAVPGRRGMMWRVRWDRVVAAACVAGVLVVGLIALTAYY